MRIQPLIFSVIGLAILGGSVFFSEALLNPQGNRAEANVPVAAPTTKILIAAGADIPFGAEIKKEDLVPQTWPVDAVPEGAIDSSAFLFGPAGSAPRRATTHIRAGDLILASKVSNFGEAVTISYALTAETRAIAINVSAATAVGGFVSPGDRVDIVLTQGRDNTLRTGTILQNILVLGIDQNADTSGSTSGEVRTITVEVTPRDGQVLALAQQAGILSLTLRNGNATNPTDMAQITLDDVWGDAKEVVVAPVETPVIVPQTVTVRRGVESESVVVQ